MQTLTEIKKDTQRISFKQFVENALDYEQGPVSIDRQEEIDDFLKEIFEKFKAEHKAYGNFNTLEFEVDRDKISCIDIRNLVPEDPKNENDQNEFYEYLKEIFSKPLPKTIFDDIQTADANIIEKIKSDFTNNGNLLTLRDVRGDTPLFSILFKMKTLSEEILRIQKKYPGQSEISQHVHTKNFHELQKLSIYLITRYPTLIAAEYTFNNEGSSIFHRIAWYARNVHSPMLSESYLDIAKTLINLEPTADSKIALLSMPKKDKREIIKDTFFGFLELNLPQTEFVSDIMGNFFNTIKPDTIQQPLQPSDFKNSNAASSKKNIHALEKESSPSFILEFFERFEIADQKNDFSGVLQILSETISENEKGEMDYPLIKATNQKGNTVLQLILWKMNQISNDLTQTSKLYALQNLAINIVRSYFYFINFQQTDVEGETLLHNIIQYAKASHKNQAPRFLAIAVSIINHQSDPNFKFSLFQLKNKKQKTLLDEINFESDSEKTSNHDLVKAKMMMFYKGIQLQIAEHEKNSGSTIPLSTFSHAFSTTTTATTLLHTPVMIATVSTDTPTVPFTPVIKPLISTVIGKNLSYDTWKKNLYDELGVTLNPDVFVSKFFHGDRGDIIGEFWKGVLEQFERRHPDIIKNILIDIDDEDFQSMAVDSNEFVINGDYSQTKSYKTFESACLRLMEKQNLEVFIHVKNLDIKSLLFLLNKDTSLLGLQDPKTGETLFNTLLTQIQNLLNQKKDVSRHLLFAEQILSQYSYELATSFVDRSKTTALDKALHCTRNSKNIEQYNIFIKISKKLLSSISEVIGQDNYLKDVLPKILRITKSNIFSGFFAKKLSDEMRNHTNRLSTILNPDQLFKSIESADEKAVNRFLAENPDELNLIVDSKSGRTPLMAVLKAIYEPDPKTGRARKSEDLASLEKIALEIIFKCNLNLKDKNGDSALHYLFRFALIDSQNTQQLKIFTEILRAIINSKKSFELHYLFSLKNHSQDEKSTNQTPTRILFRTDDLDTTQKSNAEYISLFLLSLRPKPDIFQAIKIGNLKDVQTCLAKDKVNDWDYQFGSSPLQSVIVEMNNLFIQNAQEKLSDESFKNKIFELQQIAFAIIDAKPDLSQKDWSGNTTLHRLLWYAVRTAKDIDQVKIFLLILDRLKPHISADEYHRLLAIKNDLSENFESTTHNKKLDTAQKLYVKKYLDQWKKEIEKTHSLRSELEVLLTDEINDKFFENPRYIPQVDHGQTLSEKTWNDILKDEKSALNPFSRKAFTKDDLRDNFNIKMIAAILNKTDSSGVTATDNQKIASILGAFLDIWKQSPDYKFNLSLQKAISMIERFTPHQSTKGDAKENKTDKILIPEKLISFEKWETNIKKAILMKQNSENQSIFNLFKEMIDIFKTNNPTYAQMFIDELSPIFDLDFMLQNLPDCKKSDSDEDRTAKIVQTGYYQAFSKLCCLHQIVEQLEGDKLPAPPSQNFTTLTTTTTTTSTTSASTTTFSTTTYSDSQLSKPSASVGVSIFFSTQPERNLTLKQKFQALKRVSEKLMREIYKRDGNDLELKQIQHVVSWIVERTSDSFDLSEQALSETISLIKTIYTGTQLDKQLEDQRLSNIIPSLKKFDVEDISKITSTESVGHLIEPKKLEMTI